jgi:diadenosine tetraphosphate (Ap4A) HIT family hydrolase
MAQKNHFTVVRNAAYGGGEFKVRERHNERKNENYHNGDIIQERAALNIHFHQNLSPAGSPETYEQTFNRLLDEGVTNKRGLKPGAKLFDELVFDVNTTYFEERGGYEFAKTFFEEAYRLAVKEIGGEQFILSAVLHADERNVALSDEHGRDIFHYHLHVVYVPVVQKEVYYRKDCKDKEKAGTPKEVITQISHSKKWPQRMPVERDGKTVILNSYSLLQDRYFEHMKAAGFDGFERGERGSTREHLSDLEFKTKAETERLAEKTTKVEKKEARLDRFNEQITVKEKAKATIAEVEAMGKPALIGSGFVVTADEMKKLKTLAKKSVTADDRVRGARKKQKAAEDNLSIAEHDRDIWKSRYNSLFAEVKDFLSAIRNFPQKLRDFIDAHWRERRQQRSHSREVTL